MVFRKNRFFNTVRMVLVGAPLVLTACHSDLGPFPMPTGYKYHDERYKAPPGPEPVFKKIKHDLQEEFSEEAADDKTECVKVCHDDEAALKEAPAPAMMPAMAPPPVAAVREGEWDYAGNDLAMRLIDSFGRPTEPVYIRPAAMAADMELEKALRHALLDRGFNIAPAPGMGPFVLDYAHHSLSVGEGNRHMINVVLTSRGESVAEVSGIYEIGAPVPFQPMPEPHEFGGPAAMDSGQPVPLLSPPN